MSQVEKTQQIIQQAESSGEVLKHMCELMAMLVDKLDAGEFRLVVKRGQKKSAPSGITMKTFMAKCEESGEQLMPADSAPLKYAATKKIPRQFVALALNNFVETYRDSSKRYSDWRKTFLNCLKKCGYGLWYCKADGSYELTSAGHQAKRKHGG